MDRHVTNIVINRTSENGTWYSKIEHNKKSQGLAVVFFQREAKQSPLRGILDFFKGIRKGTEVAGEYVKELGISGDAEKNAKQPLAISETVLNETIQSAYKNVNAKKAPASSEPLVSKANSEVGIVKVRINNKLVLSAEHTVQKAKDKQEQELQKDKNKAYTNILMVIGSGKTTGEGIDLPAIKKAIDITEDIGAGKSASLSLRQLAEMKQDLGKMLPPIAAFRSESFSKTIASMREVIAGYLEDARDSFTEQIGNSTVKWVSMDIQIEGDPLKLPDLEKKELKANLELIFEESEQINTLPLKERPSDAAKLRESLEWLDKLLDKNLDYELKFSPENKADLKNRKAACKALLA